MRGFTKAAAFLSLSCASSLVIPDSSVVPISPVLDYKPQDAFVKFDINTAGVTKQYPPFIFQVKSTDKACGESRILLNGLELDTQWDGTTAHGRDYLDIDGGEEAEWHISCLFDTVPTDGRNSNGDDVVHVLSLRIGSSADVVPSGFTISYKQKAPPAVLRFKPWYHSFNIDSHPDLIPIWRMPSLDFDPEVLNTDQKNLSPTLYESFRIKENSLGAYLESLKGSLRKEVEGVIEHFCPKHREEAKAKALQPVAVPSDRLLEPPPVEADSSYTPTDITGSTKTVHHSPAATTRSLGSLGAQESYDASIESTSTNLLPPPTDHNLHLLKLFALFLILGSCVTWICLRCRDPRRRAECLARREERRNKKLYRRAARQHKIRMWFWSLRLKYGLAPREALDWDEKRFRVNQQQAILEAATSNHIRDLNIANRCTSNAAAAEEGRNAFDLDFEGSERRRSVSTLPGYESEGSQPPAYEDIESGLAVVNGFRYVPAETEFRSDSSVISTSPRISRDGTNSDFDEKFEPISLAATEV